MAHDLRYAFRSLRQNPWFSAAIIVTLALGIGVNTTVFTLVNAVLYKPVPLPNGDRLAIISATDPKRGHGQVSVPYDDIADFRAAAGSLVGLEGYQEFGLEISEPGNPPESVRAARVTAGMFDLLQIPPAAGRPFRPDDEKAATTHPVLLLSHTLWTSRYAANPAVIGRTVRVNGLPAEIIGIMPPDFRFPQLQDAWMVAAPEPNHDRRQDRRFMLIGLLRPGVTREAAQADLARAAERLSRAYPTNHRDYGVSVRTFHQAMNGGKVRTVFLLMLGAVGFVLLIACANVANLLLSRDLARAREISIRAALGAGQWRIARQLFTESLLLSFLGGAAGLGLAWAGVRAFDSSVADVGKPYWIQFTMDAQVALYFLGLCVLAALLFGTVPALRASRADLNGALKEGTRGAGGSRRARLLTAGLVVGQLMLATVLLSGAGLLVRSFFAAQTEFSAVPVSRIFHAAFYLPENRYQSLESRINFEERALARAAALPGVEHAALVSNPPGMGGGGWRIELSGSPIPDPERRPAVTTVTATPGYFQLLGLNPIDGRDFNESDGLPGHETVLVSQTFASRHFPRQNPIGRQIRLFDHEAKPRPWMTVVGVVPDIRQHDPSSDADPVLFLPYHFEPSRWMVILLRTSTDAGVLSAPIRAEVAALDPDLPLRDLGTLAERMERSYWHLRVFGTVFALFGAIAIGMAAVGIYAVVAHATSRRTREIGVRMALGARPGTILRMVLRQGLPQLLTGLALGLGAAFATGRLLSGILFLVSPSDTLTYLAVALLLLTSGVAACLLPARRAARLDPLEALRQD